MLGFSLPPYLLPPSSGWPGVLVPLIPGVGETPNGFAQSHGELRNRLQALDRGGRQPVAPREKQLGVAQNSGQWVIHFVAENFSEVARQFLA